MQIPEPLEEHRWLQRLVGEWTFENECTGPDGTSMKSTGREVVRSLGGLWTIGEGTGAMPDGGEHSSIMTLGFDPVSKRFVGTFVASVMTHLWPYSGTLDPTGKVLTLDSEGPGFSGDGSMMRYQDLIEFLDDDNRMLYSQVPAEDGSWTRSMTAHYRRVR